MNPRRLTPSMSLLLAFESSARHLSFTRAAGELSLTQSAVSRQVQALEELLGIALFRRERQRITLSAAGELYRQEIAVSLQRIRQASLQAIAARSGAGTMQLAVLPTFGAKWLLPRLGAFYRAHPGIQVNIHARIGRFDVTQAGVDAVIGAEQDSWPGMVAHHLFDEYVVPVVDPATLRHARVRKPADLTRYLLLQVAGRTDVWRRWFEANGVEAGKLQHGPHFELTSHLVQAAAAGLGLGLLPDFLVREELEQGLLSCPFPQPFATGRAYSLFVPAERADFGPVKTFTGWLLEQR